MAQLLVRSCLLLLWMCSWLSAAAAQPLRPVPIVLQAGQQDVLLDGRGEYWVDRGRKLDVEAIAARGDALGWSTMQPGQQHRLDDAALWIRFAVDIRDRDSWYVALQSSGLDRVQLFHRRADGSLVVEEAGDTRPVSQWPVPGRVPTFELEPQTGSVQQYWLRIEHDRVDFAAPIRLSSQAHLFAARETEQFLFGAYFGISMLLALVAIFNAIGFRDRVFAIYAVYLVTFTLGQAAYMGVGAQHLWDPWLTFNAHSTFLLPALSAPAALWFVQRVTEPARFSRRLNQLVFVMMTVLLAVALLEVVLPSRGILSVRLVLTGLSLALVAVLIGFVWSKGDDPDIRIIALGFVPVLVMALFPILRGINLIPNSVFTRYGLAMGASVEMPILFYALSRRGSRRREAQLRASALPRTDALTGLADRRSLLQRLDATMARARQQKHPCALVVARLANYDAIASQHGRDMLDRALVVTASHLRRAATDVDLAARAGEREFALLIEGPTTADQASSRAQQIVASGLRSSQALPLDMTLRLVVVVALLPDQQPDAESSLQWVLGALAAIRPDTRKQIRSLNFSTP